MAACIVCNQVVPHDDLQDGDDTSALCARLEKVLDEPVPQGSVMCPSCESDLSQIETYYTLLTVFKKRYADSAKQRLQSSEGETSRNFLMETSAADDSENLQNMFGEAAQRSESSMIQLPMTSDKVAEDDHSEISVPCEILNVQTVKEELDVSMPGESSSTDIGETLDEILPSMPLLLSSPEVTQNKRGRPRISERFNDASESSLIASPRKRGRPRKHEQRDVDKSIKKKRGRPKRKKLSDSVAATGASTMPGKKRGRPRKRDGSKRPQSVYASIAQAAEWAPETNVEEGAEMMDLDKVKTEPIDPSIDPPSTENVLVDDGTMSGSEHGESQMDQDPDFIDSNVKPGRARQRKKRKPKRAEKESQLPITCSVCNKVFNDRYKFRMHMKCHAEDRPHVCTICGKGFKLRSNLYGHMKIHTAEKTFKCSCGKAFFRRSCLDRHALVHTDLLPFQCNLCERRFKSQDNLRVHNKLVHIQGRKFLCNICGMALYTAGNLRVHLTTHDKVKPFQCQTCGKRCSTKQTLINHESSHTEEGRTKYLCPTCGKAFANKSYLTTHIRQLHTGESKHFCTICNKSIISGSAYRVHMLIHQDQKPHQCTECGKKFRIKVHLKQHMMSHSDERPFKCPCGQSFRQKSKLERHMNTKIHAEYEARSNSARPKKAPGGLNVPRASASHPEPQPVDPPVPTVGCPQPLVPTVPTAAPSGGGTDVHEMMLAYQS